MHQNQQQQLHKEKKNKDKWHSKQIPSWNGSAESFSSSNRISLSVTMTTTLLWTRKHFLFVFMCYSISRPSVSSSTPQGGWHRGPDGRRDTGTADGNKWCAQTLWRLLVALTFRMTLGFSLQEGMKTPLIGNLNGEPISELPFFSWWMGFIWEPQITRAIPDEGE